MRSQDARSASIFTETDIDLPTLLLALLPPRRDAAVPIARLARMAGASKRATEEALQELASSGKHGICAASGPPYGVWLGTPEEVRLYVDRLKARLEHQRHRLAGLQVYLRNQPEPQLWDAIEDAA